MPLVLGQMKRHAPHHPPQRMALLKPGPRALGMARNLGADCLIQFGPKPRQQGGVKVFAAAHGRGGLGQRGQLGLGRAAEPGGFPGPVRDPGVWQSWVR